MTNVVSRRFQKPVILPHSLNDFDNVILNRITYQFYKKNIKLQIQFLHKFDGDSSGIQ